MSGKILLAVGLSLAALCYPQTALSSLRGAISGTLLDEAGRPLPGWHVVAGQWNYHSGRREFDLLPPGDTSTKRDGGFVIDNLAPGEYYIRAENPYLHILDLQVAVPHLPALATPKNPGEIYVTTYFPSVIDVTSASSIRVTAGAETRGNQFHVRSARVFRIRGRINSPGGRGGLMSIKLLDSLVPGDNRSVFAGAGGTIELDRLLPGTYVIEGSNQETAYRQVVTLTNHDLNDVTVDVGHCPKVKGTITLNGTPAIPETASDPTISLSRLDEALTVFGRANGNGAFTVPCVEPEHYTVSMPIEPGIYVKSITLDGKDVTNAPLDLTPPGDKTLDIVLSSKAAELRGTVRGASGKPQPAVQVTLWNAENDFNLTATSAPNGTFQFSNLPPGNYRIAAWDQLHSQPAGWGVQTIREFRNNFDTAATRVILSEGQHLSIDPALVPRSAIEQAAPKLNLTAVMNPTAEVDAIALAAKSPETLARFLESNRNIDWKLLWSALGLTESEYWLAPCGSNFLAAEAQCSTEIERVSKPGQVILIIRGDQLSYTVEYLRFLQDSKGGWRFAGEYYAYSRYSPGHHKLMQFGDKPFLAISSDHSQNGMATQQVLEDWFDLTQPGFDPVFSMTVDGGQWRFGFGVGRTMHASYGLIQAAGLVEKIELTLDVHFNGVGLDHEAWYLGVYERPTNGKKFALRNAYSGLDRRTPIPTKDFEDLADPFSDLSNAKLLAYALPGLKKVAAGSDSEAKTWLRSVLDEVEDTPEKRLLLGLLTKR